MLTGFLDDMDLPLDEQRNVALVVNCDEKALRKVKHSSAYNAAMSTEHKKTEHKKTSMKPRRARSPSASRGRGSSVASESETRRPSKSRGRSRTPKHRQSRPGPAILAGGTEHSPVASGSRTSGMGTGHGHERRGSPFRHPSSSRDRRHSHIEDRAYERPASPPRSRSFRDDRPRSHLEDHPHGRFLAEDLHYAQDDYDSGYQYHPYRAEDPRYTRDGQYYSETRYAPSAPPAEHTSRRLLPPLTSQQRGGPVPSRYPAAVPPPRTLRVPSDSRARSTAQDEITDAPPLNQERHGLVPPRYPSMAPPQRTLRAPSDSRARSTAQAEVIEAPPLKRRKITNEVSQSEPRGEGRGERERSAAPSGALAPKRKREEVSPPPPQKMKHFRFAQVDRDGLRLYQCRLNVAEDGPPAKYFYAKGFHDIEHQTRAERRIIIWNGDNWVAMPTSVRPVFLSDTERARYESEIEIHSLQ